jgi:predicted RNase H-like HicB family nuclease
LGSAKKRRSKLFCGCDSLSQSPRPGGSAVKFRIIVEPDEDGVFVATVPSLPGCVSQGATRDQAVRNVREAIQGYLESLRERGEPIPPAISEEVVDVSL